MSCVQSQSTAPPLQLNIPFAEFFWGTLTRQHSSGRMQVFTARLEANDNMKYLRTLEDWFDKLNDDGDFPKLLEVRGVYCHEVPGERFAVHRMDQSRNVENTFFVRNTLIGNLRLRMWYFLGLFFALLYPAALQANAAHHLIDLEKQQALQHTGPVGCPHAGNLQQPHYSGV